MILLEKEFRDIIRSDRTAEKAAKFIHKYTANPNPVRLTGNPVLIAGILFSLRDCSVVVGNLSS